MAIAGFKKIDATYYTSRDGNYALVKLGTGWAAFTEAESKDDMQQLCEPGTQAAAVKATKDHAAQPAPAPQAEPTPAPAAPVEAEPAPAAPKAPKRTRVTVTVEALARPQGVTAAELAALFTAEFDGNGKLSTAQQALHKVPKARELTVAKAKEEGRGLVYRSAAAAS